ncbi:EYS [Branchiostoma lanceolatum]|uniref:EYS protein n=1 Tax=Branchiostoma lanceolatum TaxID=7740 RepID=A0A8J9Z721_BRALA|nr:EYS [Branchiostoma lanceolatum]
MTSTFGSLPGSPSIAPTETILTPTPVPTITPTPTPTPVYTCQDDPCQNGATCREEDVNGQMVARCECTWWYTGQFCNSARVMTPKFLTNSYLEFPSYIVRESNAIQVSFRTAHENGTLLYAVQDYRTPQAAAYFIHLYVENGVLYYHFSCFIERFTVDTNTLVNHGNEVSVVIEHISRPGCQATVTVDNGTPVQAGRPNFFFNNVGAEMGPVYMGGVPPTFDPLTSSLPVYDFLGCVSELTINAVPYNFLYSLGGENVEECDTLPTPPPGPTVPPPPTCSETRCENGGTCRDVTTGGVLQFECDCLLHFSGDRCEEDLVVYFPSFSGNTYLQYTPLDLTQQYTNNIVVMFKTTAADATILYAAEGDGIANSVGANSNAEFVHLYLEDGTLWYRFSCGRGMVLVINTDITVNNDLMTSVVIQQSRPRPIGNNIRGMCSASVQVNSSTPVSNEVRTYFAQKSLGSLYLGGLPSDLTAVPSAGSVVNFEGCIGALQVNDLEYDLFGDAVDGENVGDCVAHSICQFVPCRNNGTCRLDADGQYFCDCPKNGTNHPLYSGELCERDVCSANPCGHGATCLPQTDGRVVCLCPYGRGGITCEDVLNVTRPAFTGVHYGYSSYIAYPQVFGLNFFFEVRFSFALANNDSALTSSLMLYTGQANQVPGWGDDYLALGIENGHVVFTFDLGSDPAYIRSSTPLDLTLPYHTVTLGRESKVGWLSVDNAANVTGEAQGELIGLNLAQGEQVFVGGYDMFQLALMPNTVNFTSGFQGCIYDMEVRTRESDPWQTLGHVESGRMVGQCSVSECDLNVCHNGGTCVDMGASFRCACQAGWKGLLCADEETVCDTTSLCADGASCVPLGLSYRCDCPLGTNGTDCQQSVTISDPSFGMRGQGSSSFMSFPRQNLRVVTQITLEFQPGAPNGILFYAAQNLNSRAGDFISLSLFDGFVEFRYNLGLEPTAVIRSGRRIDTTGSTWYVLEAGRTGKDGYLRIDGEEVTGTTNQAMVGLDIRTDFYLGGVPYLDLVANMAVEDDPSGFVGCVRRLAVNGREYDLTENGASEGMNVGDCDGTACGSNVCRNNGLCQPIGVRDFSCNCEPGYVGETCEDQASCSNHGCRNNATCVPDGTPGSHTCFCALGWTGDNCTDAITFQSARFEGNGHIFYQDPDHAHRNPTVTQLSLNFTSTQGEGLILWNGKTDTDDEDYMGLGVRDGKLLFSINLGYLAKETVRSTADVDDGQWHSVIIQRSRRVVTVYLDGQPYPAVNGIDVGGASVGLNTGGLFHIGGFELGVNVTVSTFGLYTAGLTGCVRDVVIYRDTSAVSLAQADRGNNVYSCDGR